MSETCILTFQMSKFTGGPAGRNLINPSQNLSLIYGTCYSKILWGSSVLVECTITELTLVYALPVPLPPHRHSSYTEENFLNEPCSVNRRHGLF